AAWSGQRHQTRSLEQALTFGDLALAANECRRLRGEPRGRAIEAVHRREIRGAAGDHELIDVLRLREIFQVELAEVAERDAVRELRTRERRGRIGDKDLPAVRSRGDACRAMHVDADVVRAGFG